MAEISMIWDGVTGDGGPYADSDIMDTCFRALLAGTGNEGVLRGWLNELQVTDGGVDTATVATGGAILYGLWFENDAAINVNVNAYRGGNCRIVVRRWWVGASQPPPGALVEPLARIHLIDTIGGEFFRQVSGDVYDIPLAQVTINAGGAITLITDQRDYCEFSTQPQVISVLGGNIQTDAATTAKMVDHTRWISRGAGTLRPDGTSAAVWTDTYSYRLSVPSSPYRDVWLFADAVSNAVWFTFRAPEDITSATVSMYLWLSWLWNPATTASGDQRWTWNAWIAQPSAVLANQTGSAVIAESTDWKATYSRRFSLGNLTVTAGDIVHCQIARTGGHGLDTSDAPSFLYMVELSYTADG